MMQEKTRKRPGPVSLFPGKRRAPVSLTLTPAHHKKVEINMRRLGLTRADLIGLLIEKYADTVVRPSRGHVYDRLRDAVAALGGSLEPRKFSGPLGETWVLTLGDRYLEIRSVSRKFPVLDACYRAKPGAAVPPAPNDKSVVDPAGLAELFRQVAESPGSPDA